MTIQTILRHVQGERPGMSAGGGELSYTFYHHPIHLQTQVRIVDVSFWQGVINFAIMKAMLVGGVIIRAGQRYWEDIRFRENWRKAKEAGLPRGSYWYYDSREDPKKQAALWWSLLQGDVGELIHAADFEENYKGPYGLPSHFRTFLQEFMRLSGIPADRIVIYTGFYWWSSRVGNDVFFRQFALWLAWYSAMEVVRVPPPWIETDLFGWQYTSSGNGPLYGVSSLEVDLSWYCCDMRTFSIRFGLGAPPDGGTMSKYYKWTANAANIRLGPGATYADRGDIVNGDVIQVDQTKVGGWFPFKIAQHADGSPVTLVDGTPMDASQTVAYWVTDAYFVEVTGLPNPPAPPDPDPDPEPTPVKTHQIDIFADGKISVDGNAPY